MRKMVLAMAFLLTFGAAPAFAFTLELPWIGSVSHDGVTWVDNVQTFDWASSGSGAAIPRSIGGADPFDAADIQIGQTFDFFFQARLTGLEGPDGNPVIWDGLNSAFEVTFVAVLPERVADITLTAGGAVAVFETLAGGAWYMYVDDEINSNTATGMGFDDGRLVAQGTFGEGQFTTFTATQPGTGIGSFIIDGKIIYEDGTPDPNFFDPVEIGGVFMSDIRLEGTVNQPATTATTTAFFGSRDGQGNLAQYTVQPGDLLFRTDASSQFSVIPEPSTVILLGLGLLGLAGYSRKKFKK